MSALPQPKRRKKVPRKYSRVELVLDRGQALRKIARLLEEKMEELGLSEAEKNSRVDAFLQDVKEAHGRKRNS
jgi:hypothetical protein